MDQEYLRQTQLLVQKELHNCITFWLTYGIDPEHGGIYTHLDRKGQIYSTDKSVWMQGRSAWLFSYLCSQYGEKEEWITSAKSCLTFLENNCFNRNAKGRMYFQVTKEGKPLRQRRYCFSEAYYTMANAQYYQLTGEELYLSRAKQSYQLIYNINNGIIKDPAGIGEKEISTTRAGHSIDIPLIFLHVIQTLAPLDPEKAKLYTRHAKECVDAISMYHMNDDLKCILATVGINGEFWSDVASGRVVNAEHSFNSIWLLLEHAKQLGEEGIPLRERACKMLEWSYEQLWDHEYGGFFYLVDCLDKPMESFENDIKLWRVHTEALTATLMAYRDTREEQYLKYFYQIWDYCQEFFSDPEYGEWHGYLARNGILKEPSIKGDSYKGPFYLPRALTMIDKMIEEILN